MNEPTFRGIPAELRNTIYAYVLGSNRMEVHFCRSCDPLRVLENFPGLLLTCKQIWREAGSLPVRRVNDFVLLPSLETSENGNDIANVSFDIDAWAEGLTRLPLMQPKVVVLDLGFVSINTVIKSLEVWRKEISNIRAHIPRRASTDAFSDLAFDFYVRLTITDDVAGEIAFDWRVRGDGDEIKRECDSDLPMIKRLVSQHQKTIRALRPHAWSELGQAGQDKARIGAWN